MRQQCRRQALQNERLRFYKKKKSRRGEGGGFALFSDPFHTNYMVQLPDRPFSFFMNEDIVLVLKMDLLNRKIIKGSDVCTGRDSPG
jgi:hypothetical protein